MIGNNAETSIINRNTLWCFTFPRSRRQTSRYNYCSASSGQGS